MRLSDCLRIATGLGDHAQQTVFFDQNVFDTVDLDRCAAVLWKQDFVTDLNEERHIVLLSCAESDNFCLLGLFLGAIRYNDAAADLFIFFNAF